MTPLPLMPKILKIPSSVGCPFHQSIESPPSFISPSCPSPDCRPHIGKRASLIAFRQNLSQILLVRCIFRSTIITYYKKLFEIKSLDSIQIIVQQDPKPVVVFALSCLKQVLMHTLILTYFSNCRHKTQASLIVQT